MCEKSKGDTEQPSSIGERGVETVFDAPSRGSGLEAVQTGLLVGKNGAEKRLDIICLHGLKGVGGIECRCSTRKEISVEF